ncbi:MAG: nitrate- and nitrite sensing domain-containing protein, partial [Bacteroidota bacterium]
HQTAGLYLRENPRNFLFLSSKGQQFGEALAAQRELTDKQLSVISKMIDLNKNSLLAPHRTSISDLEALLEGIPDLRYQIDELQLKPNEAIREYTKINTLALSIVESFGKNLGSVEMFSQASAYSSFLKSKERAGIERAIGTQGFVLGQLPEESFIWFTNLVAQQNAFTESFVRNSTADAVAYYKENLNITPVDEVARMRLKLFKNQQLNESPQYWFQQITLKINALKKVEDYLASSISSNSNSLAKTASSTFNATIIGTAIVSSVVLMLLVVILTNLLKNIKKLAVFSSRVSKGELGARVNIKSKDELGKFALTMNRMVASVKKASDQLKVERNKARYMYKNIYRTSEVVFANVTEGFFLIDSELKISSLYSKSTEGIFEQSEVGGRNFLEFVNPRLLPRDREALKVFSKHLFNPKIKDRVLNHLNPVESVSIYGDESGSGEGNVKTKYLKITFQRIKGENGTIKEVMVTSKDET